MTHSIEITSTNDQISLLPRTEKDEIQEGKKVDHLIDINGQDPSGSQTNKSINEIFDEKFKNLNNWSIKSCTIFKVNMWLRESNPNAYTPKMVSIGPYHKKNPRLRQMEKYKLLYLRRFLGRKEGLDVESCISELEKLKEKAINCYEGVEDDSQFCQMLLLDGCFVVEFIRECCGMWPEGADKIFNDNNIDYILRDLMLLENQLPFFILNKLHDMTKRDYESPLATLLASELNSLPFFVKLPRETVTFFIATSEYYNFKHLIHLVHELFCQRNRKKKPENNDDQTWHSTIPNATELSEAGVEFLKVSITTTLFDSIKFTKGLIKIPCFEVGDSTEIFLRNLIAYEQQSVDVYPKHFTDFASFMDNLIESEKDVALLRKKGIIVNRIREDKRVTNLFNKIRNEVIIIHPNFYYQKEFRKLVAYCKKRRNRRKQWLNRTKASLKHNYFSSLWVGSSTVAAIILLILTTIQTILSIIDSNK